MELHQLRTSYEYWRRRTHLGIRHVKRSGREVRQATDTLAPIIIPAIGITAIALVKFLAQERGKRKINIDIFDQDDLLVIVRSAYQPKTTDGNPCDFREITTDNVTEVQWDYKNPDTRERLAWTDPQQRMYNDLVRVLMMMWDIDTRAHLQPLIGIPVIYNGQVVDTREPNWHSPDETCRGVSELALYYANRGVPENLTTLVARDHKGIPQGVMSLRWDGYQYLSQRERGLAIIEKSVVDPDSRGNRIFSKLLDAALKQTYEERNYQHLAAWVLTDRQAGDFSKPFSIYVDRGFRPMVQWSALASLHHTDTGGREGFLMVHNRDQFIPVR